VLSNDFEKLWKETVLAKFEVLCWHLPGETEEDNENCKQDGLRTEIRTQNFLHMKQECCLLCDDDWFIVLQKDIYDVIETCIILFALNHYHPAT